MLDTRAGGCIDAIVRIRHHRSNVSFTLSPEICCLTLDTLSALGGGIGLVRSVSFSCIAMGYTTGSDEIFLVKQRKKPNKFSQEKFSATVSPYKTAIPTGR